jgi:GDP-L-fucose synthase
VAKPMPIDARIFVAGHAGLVGGAVVRRLEAAGYHNLLLARRSELDLRDQAAVNTWMAEHRPEYVFLVAGTVGGIMANSTRPAEFIYDNMMIHATIVHAAHLVGVTKLLYLGSSCIYPRNATQPITEEALLTGLLEPTNEPYAIAKIAGIKLCQAYKRQYGCDFISAMPTNLYGPGDNYNLDTSHVIPALLRKFHEARVQGEPQVTVWGSGTPRREFMYSDDMARACLHIMQLDDTLFDRLRGGDELATGVFDPPLVNVGVGEDLSIAELAALVARVVGFEGGIVYDTSKPDGTPRKLMDSSRLLSLGWRPQVGLEQGLRQAYEDFKATLAR